MALDTGRVTDLNFNMEGDSDPVRIESYVPNLTSGPDIGAALKAAREFRGLSLEDVADSTRIRRSYLAAIEEMRLDDLPSRPFTIGYVRAYAQALGMDGEAAVDRFKVDEPASDAALPEPIGVQRDGDPRLTLVMITGALILAAIILWNIAQRALAEREPPPAHTAPETIISSAPPPGGPVSLGAPLPAPVESTTPIPYETPGLAEATAGDGSSDALEAAKKLAKENPTAQPAAAQEILPATFVAKGAVYGAEAETSIITFQARKAASLIVRGADGSVYFARQLSPGEAYRAPALKGLSVEVSEAEAFQVFVGGQTKGLMPATQTTIAKLVS